MLTILTLDIMEMTFYLCYISAKNSWPQYNHEKNIRQIPIEEHVTKHQTNTPLNCHCHQNKQSLRNCHSREEPRETR